MVATSLTSKTVKVLEADLQDARAHLRELKFKLSSGQLKNVREARKTKKEISRLLTALAKKVAQADSKSEHV